MKNVVKNTAPKRRRKLVSCFIDQHDKCKLEVVTQTIIIFYIGRSCMGPTNYKEEEWIRKKE